MTRANFGLSQRYFISTCKVLWIVLILGKVYFSLPSSYLATYCQLTPCQEKQVHNHVCVCMHTRVCMCVCIFFLKRCNSALAEHVTPSASPGAGAVIHTHSKAAVMATLLFPGREFKITHQEMIKGIKKCTSGGYYRYFFFYFCLNNLKSILSSLDNQATDFF